MRTMTCTEFLGRSVLFLIGVTSWWSHWGPEDLVWSAVPGMVFSSGSWAFHCLSGGSRVLYTYDLLSTKICSLKDKNKKCKTFQSSSNFIAFNLCYDMFDKSSVFHSFHYCTTCSLHLFFMAHTRWSTLKCNPVLRKDCSNSSFSFICVFFTTASSDESW